MSTFDAFSGILCAVGDERRKEYLMSKVMPRPLVGGLAAMVSIIVAENPAPMLG